MTGLFECDRCGSIEPGSPAHILVNLDPDAGDAIDLCSPCGMIVETRIVETRDRVAGGRP